MVKASTTDITNMAMEAVQSHPSDVVVESPPGAGKTSLLIDLVALNSLALNRTSLVAAISNDQCDDITRRAAIDFPRLRIDRFVASGDRQPRLADLPNVNVVDATGDLSAPVVIANIEKFGQVNALGYVADELFIDEAYQARRADYDRVRALAKKAALIGDPGQIRPIYQADIRLYAGDDCGPHVAAPRVLLKHKAAVHLQMKHTRRLPQDTVDVIGPSFYPDMPFTALALAGQRMIIGGLHGTTPLDKKLDGALKCGSLSMIALPNKIVPRVDREVIETVVGVVKRMIQRQFQFRDDGTTGTVTEKDIGVVAFRREQVTAIRQALGRGIYVETANRFQGLERRVIVALHPMSGAERISDFNIEAGRVCVALSRHRIACIMVARDGLLDVVERAVPEDERHLGRPDDPVYEGIRAHRTLVERLEAQNIIVHG